MSDLLPISNDDGESYEIRQNNNGYVEIITAKSRRYISPETLFEAIDEYKEGQQ